MIGLATKGIISGAFYSTGGGGTVIVDGFIIDMEAAAIEVEIDDNECEVEIDDSPTEVEVSDEFE